MAFDMVMYRVMVRHRRYPGGVSAIGTTATSRLLVHINSINWVDVGVFYGPGAPRGPMTR